MRCHEQVYLERQDDVPESARKGRAPDSSNWEAVARLLSRKHDRIDSLHALDLLPGEVQSASNMLLCRRRVSAMCPTPCSDWAYVLHCIES